MSDENKKFPKDISPPPPLGELAFVRHLNREFDGFWSQRELYDELRLVVNAHDLQHEYLEKRPGASIWLDFIVSFLEKYEKSGDPYYLIRVFTLCHSLDIYPPLIVLDWLNSAMLEYLESGRRGDLVKGLRLKSSPTVHKASGEAWARSYFVHLLNTWCGLSVDEAAYMVHEREKANGGNPRGSDWIAEDYKKNWKPKQSELSGDSILFDTEEKKQEFIRSFPEWSLPTRLKKTRP